MHDNRRNIAKIGRSFAGLTQERWAEALGYSVRTVGAWENGEQPVPSEAVIRMVDVTGQQVLAYWHLVDSAGNENQLLPDVDIVDLPQAVLALLRRLKDFDREQRVDKLIEMAEDGRIDEAERNGYDNIMQELHGIIKAAVQLQFAKGVVSDADDVC